MGGAWDSLHSRVYDTLERESPGKEANTAGCAHPVDSGHAHLWPALAGLMSEPWV